MVPRGLNERAHSSSQKLLTRDTEEKILKVPTEDV